MEPEDFASQMLEKFAEENGFSVRSIEDLSMLEGWLLWELYELAYPEVQVEEIKPISTTTTHKKPTKRKKSKKPL